MANATALRRADFPEAKIKIDAATGTVGTNQTFVVIQEFIL